MSHSRRDFLKGTGALTGSIVAVSGTAWGDHSVEQQNGWLVRESPTTKTLNAATHTLRGPYAVGEGGDVLARYPTGWKKVVEYGPAAKSSPLNDVDVTDDRRAIWFAGGSGVIGEYDVVTETLTDYSAPMGKTSTWEAVCVKGAARQGERLYFVNGSGEELSGTRQPDGSIKWDEVTKPGGGSTIPGIDFNTPRTGACVSTSQGCFETTDGQSYTQIGVANSSETFNDIQYVAPDDINIAASAGTVYRYDGHRWTPHVISDARRSILAIDRNGEFGLAAGNGGWVYDRRSAGDWVAFRTPKQAKLKGASFGENDAFDVVVGANGTIMERPRGASHVHETKRRAEDVKNTTDDYLEHAPNGSDVPNASDVPNVSQTTAEPERDTVWSFLPW